MYFFNVLHFFCLIFFGKQKSWTLKNGFTFDFSAMCMRNPWATGVLQRWQWIRFWKGITQKDDRRYLTRNNLRKIRDLALQVFQAGSKTFNAKIAWVRAGISFNEVVHLSVGIPSPSSNVWDRISIEFQRRFRSVFFSGSDTLPPVSTSSLLSHPYLIYTWILMMKNTKNSQIEV